MQFVVRTSFVVNLAAKDLARLVFLRERAIMETFERAAGAAPPSRGGFDAHADPNGVQGRYTIEFSAETLEGAWAIWKLGSTAHPELDWDLRACAAEKFSPAASVPDYCPDEL